MEAVYFDNNNKLKNIIHTNLRKNNIEKCEWLKNNISKNIELPTKKDSNFLVFDDNWRCNWVYRI